MAKINGYDGGDGEDQLIAALKHAIDIESGDAWARIRDKDMWIGSVVDICLARRYVKASRLGFAGYFVTKIGYAETYIRQCWQCWKLRRDFDPVRDWVSKNNSYKPNKASGPLLFLDAHKAWSERLQPAAKKRAAKKLSAKEMRQLVQAYRNMLDRTGGAYVQLSEEVGSEPRVWHQITRERAVLEAELDEGAGDSDFPVNATPDAQDVGEADVTGDRQYQNNGPNEDTPGEEIRKDAANDDYGPSTEQYPGTGMPGFTEVIGGIAREHHQINRMRPETSVPNTERYQGTETPDFAEVIGGIARARGQINRLLSDTYAPQSRQHSGTEAPNFKIVGAIVKPKRRQRPPRKLRLVSPNTPDETSKRLDVPVTAETLAKVEKEWGLKGWPSRRAKDDTEVRCKRATFFVLHPETTKEDAAWFATQNRDFWRGADDDATVLRRLPQKKEGS